MLKYVLYTVLLILFVPLIIYAGKKSDKSERQDNYLLSGGWTNIEGERVEFDEIAKLKGLKVVQSDSNNISYGSTSSGPVVLKIMKNLSGVFTFFNFFVPDDGKTVRIVFTNTWPYSDIYIDEKGPYGGTSKYGIGFVHRQLKLGKNIVKLNDNDKLLASGKIEIKRNYRQYECIGKELKCNISERSWSGR